MGHCLSLLPMGVSGTKGDKEWFRDTSRVDRISNRIKIIIIKIIMETRAIEISRTQMGEEIKTKMGQIKVAEDLRTPIGGTLPNKVQMCKGKPRMGLF